MTAFVSLSRRLFLSGVCGLALTGIAHGETLVVPSNGGRLNAVQAHELASAQAITLVDIRRPDEWAATGSGAGAVRLDLRRRDFVSALRALVDGDTSAPIALICARGVRSLYTSRQLAKAGFTNIIDIPEGMMGSRAGPGWLKRGLPVVRD